jgi:hypothetical protein
MDARIKSGHDDRICVGASAHSHIPAKLIAPESSQTSLINRGRRECRALAAPAGVLVLTFVRFLGGFIYECQNRKGHQQILILVWLWI